MIEWKIGDEGWEPSNEEENWYQQGESGEPGSEDSGQRPRWRRRIAATLGLMLVLALVVAGAVKWEANRNVARARAEVQSVLDQEMWALESGNLDLYESLLDFQAPQQWFRDQLNYFIQNAQHGSFAAQIVDFSLIQPDLALVTVRIDPPDRQVYQETRAYQQAGPTWQHTMAPAGHVFVRPVLFETENLRFVYHEDDAERLQPILPTLQTLYSQLLADFELLPPPGKRELHITLSVQPANSIYSDASRRYDLSALAGTTAPSELQRELGRQLTAKVTAQFYRRVGNMGFVLDGIREWEVSSWMGVIDPQTEERIVATLADKEFIPLWSIQPAQMGKATSIALTETVIEYLVWRQGREALRDLIKNLGRHDTWTELIQKQLGISHRDAALGWWHFIARRYGIQQMDPDHEVLVELAWMVEQEKQAVETRDRSLFRSLLDPRAPARWQGARTSEFFRRFGKPTAGATDIQNWGYQDHIAWVILNPRPDAPPGSYGRPDGTAKYFDLRFYRFDGREWYLTSPEIAFNHAPLSTQTRYFEILYYEPDVELVAAVAIGLDRLYEQVVQDLNIVDVVPPRLRIRFLYSLYESEGRNERDEILLYSPRLHRDFTDFQFNLGIDVTRALLASVADLPDWWPNQALLSGLVLWEVEEWGQVPANWQEQKKDYIRNRLKNDPFDPSYLSPSSLDITIAEYIATRYGRQYLAYLLEAAVEQRNFQDVITAAINVDTETFLAGWQAYLEENYGS